LSSSSWVLRSQQTRNPGRLREWKKYVRAEAAKLWLTQAPVEIPLKLTVVYYHERPSVPIDHDNMIKPIQDALAGLVYVNDRQSLMHKLEKPISTDDFVCGTCCWSTLVLSVAVGSSFNIRIEEAPSHEELL
jgi:crossover junction endodeoxyribonuclease RusA